MPVYTLKQRIKLALSLGLTAGLGACFLLLIHLTVLLACEYLWPRHTIEHAEEFDYVTYEEDPAKFGNHKFEVEKPGTLPGYTDKKRFSI